MKFQLILALALLIGLAGAVEIKPSQINWSQTLPEGDNITLDEGFILSAGTDGMANVKAYGATGDGVTDDTAAIQAAVDTGLNVYFPNGVYLTEEINISTASRGAIFYGDGYYHYTNGTRTVIKAKTASQDAVFTSSGGADGVTFRDLRIDGDNKAKIGINGTNGAFVTIDQCGIYNCVDYGFYSHQGLSRIDRCYFSNPGADANIHLFSDSTITNTESNQGNIGINITGGGCHLTNVWVNYATVAGVRLQPYAGASHYNTAITGLYVGEIVGSGVPMVQIRGSVSQYVDGPRIENSYFVCASGLENKTNVAIDVDYCRDLIVTGCNVLGTGSPTSDFQLKNFVDATNLVGAVISNNIVKMCTKNIIVLGENCYGIQINGNQFYDYALSEATGVEGAAIKITNNYDYGVINGNSFDISDVSTVPFAVYGGDASRFNFFGNLVRYSNSSVWIPSTGSFHGGYKRMGGNYIPSTDEELIMLDGISAPGGTTGKAKIYVDTSDGDLKVVFGDGKIKTIVADT